MPSMISLAPARSDVTANLCRRLNSEMEGPSCHGNVVTLSQMSIYHFGKFDRDLLLFINTTMPSKVFGNRQVLNLSWGME